MKRLLIVFLTVFLTSVFAHADKHVNLGDRASELKEEGKSEDIHPDLKEIRIMHPNFLMHKRDKTLRQGIRTKRNSLKACVNCIVRLIRMTNLCQSTSRGSFVRLVIKKLVQV